MRLQKFDWSPNWYIVWYDGSRSRRNSTGTVSRKKAELRLGATVRGLKEIGRHDVAENIKREAPQRRASRWYIYVIGADHSGLIKIGYCAKSTQKRLRALQTGSPVRLHVTGCARVAKEHEASAVERYAHHKLSAFRRHGEWFCYPAGKAVDLIKDAASGNLPAGYWAERMKGRWAQNKAQVVCKT